MRRIISKKILTRLFFIILFVLGIALIFKQPPIKAQSSSIEIDNIDNSFVFNIDSIRFSLYEDLKEIKEEKFKDVLAINNLIKLNNDLAKSNNILKKEINNLKNTEIPIIIDTVYIEIHDTINKVKSFWGKEKIKKQ